MSLDEYYERLGLPSGASPAEIKSAYRRLRATFHPDRNRGKEANVEPIFKRIQEAFEILTGERRPPQAARTQAHEHPRHHTTRSHGSASGPSQRAGAGWPPSGRWDSYRTSSGAGSGATASSASTTPVRGANRHQPLHIPLEIALNGGDMPIAAQASETCRHCGGQNTRFVVEPCTRCGGKGQWSDGMRCDECVGAGRTMQPYRCPACESRTRDALRRPETVRVPPGAWDGQRLVVEGAGFPGINGGPAGDAVYSIVVLCGSDFRRDGLNLTAELRLDFVAAIVGGTHTIRLLGREHALAIPSNVQPGTLIRLSGEGLSDATGNRGELRFQVVLTMPEAAAKLTQEERQRLKAVFDAAAHRTKPH